jgi:2-haloacid dehalogenase
VATVTGADRPFGEIALAALQMTAEQAGAELADDRDAIAAQLRQLPAHPEVPGALRRLKPAPEPYRHAAERLGVPVGQVRLVAAHAWDVAGAARAGCATAFVARPGKVLDPLVAPPEVVGADLGEVADRIVAVDG